MTTRTKKTVDCRKVRYFTEKRHWDVRDLQTATTEKDSQCKKGISESTIRTILDPQNEKWLTYAKKAYLIADALDVNVSEILWYDSGVLIQMVLDNNLTEDAIQALKAELAKWGVQVLSFWSGSLVVICDVDPIAARTFMAALKNGELDHLSPITATATQFKNGSEIAAQTINRFIIPPKNHTPQCTFVYDARQPLEIDVCGLSRYEGGNNRDLDEAHEEGTALLPNQTRDPNECVVYVTQFQSIKLGKPIVYAQSNLLTDVNPNYPFKMVMEKPSPLLTVAKIVLYGDLALTTKQVETATQLHTSTFRYVVNRKLVPSNESSEIEFSGASRWMVSDPAKWYDL